MTEHDQNSRHHDEDQPETEKDTVSDPGLGATAGHDWSNEGGATEQGPAD